MRSIEAATHAVSLLLLRTPARTRPTVTHARLTQSRTARHPTESPTGARFAVLILVWCSER